jgi:cellobiose-specific phosphotransferase system component IIB
MTDTTMSTWTQRAFVTVRAASKEDADDAFRQIDGIIIGPEVEVTLDGYPDAEPYEE